MNFYYYSKYNGKSTIEQLRRVTFLFPPRHFILSIVDTIIKAHHASLHIMSEVNQGTTIEIILGGSYEEA